MKSKEPIKVEIDNSKLSVDGRSYDTTHVLIQGAQEISGEITGSQVKMTVFFADLPLVEPTMEEAIKVSANGSEFIVDVLGDKIQNALETEEGYILSGDIITIKFESDENGEDIIIKIPKVGNIKTSKLSFQLDGELSTNIMTQPFIIGAISAKGPTKVKIQVSGESITILKDDSKASNEGKKIVSESTAQNT